MMRNRPNFPSHFSSTNQQTPALEGEIQKTYTLCHSENNERNQSIKSPDMHFHLAFYYSIFAIGCYINFGKYINNA